jgi:folate-dependent phosphoribosylglycinamide formyltransferase PurN
VSDQRNRVAILCGPNLTHRKTCATLIAAGVNVVGICTADQRTAGLPLKYLWKTVRRRGVGMTVGQILGRLYYNVFNKAKDTQAFSRLFNQTEIDSVLTKWNGDRHFTSDYSASKTLEWLARLEPDVLVVHSGYWVGKRVRDTARKNVVIGGHPGLTPYYRGSHPAFWAVSKGRPQDIGCSVFWLDGGVDTGDLIAQERFSIEPDDSFVTLGWKGMIRQGQIEAQVLVDLDRGFEIPRTKHSEIPIESEFQVPTLWQYLRYRRIQSAVR